MVWPELGTTTVRYGGPSVVPMVVGLPAIGCTVTRPRLPSFAFTVSIRLSEGHSTPSTYGMAGRMLGSARRSSPIAWASGRLRVAGTPEAGRYDAKNTAALSCSQCAIAWPSALVGWCPPLLSIHATKHYTIADVEASARAFPAANRNQPPGGSPERGGSVHGVSEGASCSPSGVTGLGRSGTCGGTVVLGVQRLLPEVADAGFGERHGPVVRLSFDRGRAHQSRATLRFRTIVTTRRGRVPVLS